MLQIRMFPALNGDSFLVSSGSTIEAHFLIDLGYPITFEKWVKPYLSVLNSQGKKLTRLIISHIDSDHIFGAIPFLKQNGKMGESVIIPVEQIWHNSFKHIHPLENESPIVDEGVPLTTENKIVIDSIIKTGYKDSEKVSHKDISGTQGSSLGALILKNNYPWNTDFSNGCVSVNNRTEIDINDETKLLLLSPTSSSLQKLIKIWKRELRLMGFNIQKASEKVFDDAFEFFLSHERDAIKSGSAHNVDSGTPKIKKLIQEKFVEDTTANNGSSIAFILEHKNLTALFLADSHPSVILGSLNNIYGEQTLRFNVIKVPHHGSALNFSPSLLDKIDAEIYLFSSDGSGHDHPDEETIARIVSRPTESKRTLVFNYPNPRALEFNNDSLKSKYNYEVVFPTKDSITRLELFYDKPFSVSFENP
jgi:ribonuclease BN (tRNA processing enzyme)